MDEYYDDIDEENLDLDTILEEEFNTPPRFPYLRSNVSEEQAKEEILAYVRGEKLIIEGYDVQRKSSSDEPLKDCEVWQSLGYDLKFYHKVSTELLKEGKLGLADPVEYEKCCTPMPEERVQELREEAADFMQEMEKIEEWAVFMIKEMYGANYREQEFIEDQNYWDN